MITNYLHHKLFHLDLWLAASGEDLINKINRKLTFSRTNKDFFKLILYPVCRRPVLYLWVRPHPKVLCQLQILSEGHEGLLPVVSGVAVGHGLHGKNILLEMEVGAKFKYF